MLTEQSRGSNVDGQTKPMNKYTYTVTITVAGITNVPSEFLKPKQAVTVCNAFASFYKVVDVFEDGELIHTFDLANNESITDFAEAGLEDIQLDGGFEGAEKVASILKDILFIRYPRA